MRQSRLVKRLENLGSRDKDRFSKFVNSPYFNQHDKTTQLLNLIYIAFEKGRPALLEREKIFKKLFPKEPFNEQRLHNVMSYLMRLYHRFLAYEKIESQHFEEAVATMEQAYDSDQFDVFTNRAKLFEKILKEHQAQDEHYYYHRLRYHALSREYKVNHVNSSEQQSGQAWIHALDHFYILSKLQQACQLQAHEMVMNTSYDFTLLDEVLSYLEKSEAAFEQSTTILAYYTVLKMLKETDDSSHYLTLRDLLLKHPDRYSLKNLNDLYNYASNYCIDQIKNGNDSYEKELFNIYKQSIDNETVVVNGRIDTWYYKNIATLGCHLKEFSWTYRFIEDYRDKLPENHRSNAYYYSLAFYHFCNKDFDQASDLLLEVQFTEVQYHLGGNLLLVRCYYELGNIEALISLLESLRIYVIRSKKMTTKEKKGYNNMIRFAKKLVQLKTYRIAMSRKDFEAKAQKLAGEIAKNSNVYAKAWLSDKCGEFLGTAQKEMV
ncbi:MAG: hypothetical protein AAF847_05265 [Bacteroidota bacterium]